MAGIGPTGVLVVVVVVSITVPPATTCVGRVVEVTGFPKALVGVAGLVEVVAALRGRFDLTTTAVVGTDLGFVLGTSVVVVEGGDGAGVVGEVAATAGPGDDSSQLIALAFPDPPATCGVRSGVVLEGDPSPPNSTTAIT